MHAVFYLPVGSEPRLIGVGDLDAAIGILRRNTSRGQVGGNPRELVARHGVYLARAPYAVIDTGSQVVRDVAAGRLARYPGVTHGIFWGTSGPVVGDGLLRQMYVAAASAVRKDKIGLVLGAG